MSLSRLNYGQPGVQAHPEIVQGTAELHHEIADALLPQADPVFHNTSVAERSFPLLNLVEMLGQPCLQSVLYGWRQLQDHLDKTQGLKDFKVTPSIHDNMRPLGAQLLKGDRLARLVRKTRTGLCVGKQMIQTVA